MHQRSMVHRESHYLLLFYPIAYESVVRNQYWMGSAKCHSESNVGGVELKAHRMLFQLPQAA